jgi:hypothetical protein
MRSKMASKNAILGTLLSLSVGSFVALEVYTHNATEEKEPKIKPTKSYVGHLESVRKVNDGVVFSAKTCEYDPNVEKSISEKAVDFLAEKSKALGVDTGHIEKSLEEDVKTFHIQDVSGATYHSVKDAIGRDVELRLYSSDLEKAVIDLRAGQIVRYMRDHECGCTDDE